MVIQYSQQEISDLRQQNNVPSDAKLWTLRDGTLIWSRPDITSEQLGIDRVVIDGPYDRSAFAIDGVYAIIPPRILASIQEELPDYNSIVSPLPPVANGATYININVGVYPPPRPAQTFVQVNFNILPQIPTLGVDSVSLPWELLLRPIPIALTDAIVLSARRLLDGKVESYFDQNRVGKTLLNFGNDFQVPIINWKYDDADTTGNTIVVKTYQPIPDDVNLFSQLWIDRELSTPFIDQLYVVYSPDGELRVYLRPPNKNINVRASSGQEVTNATLNSLLPSASFTGVSNDDPILNEWYVTSLEGAELNINYNNFNEFIFYSSARERVNAFTQKMLMIEDFDRVIAQQSSSILTIAGNLSSSVIFPAINRIVNQREDVIRSFDAFERYLYYSTNTSYSSSFTDDHDDEFYFCSPFEWPKVNGVPISVASASNANLFGSVTTNFGDQFGGLSYLEAIQYIASQYDNKNQNRLANNIPEYLVNDPRSQDFVKFLDMIGHHFDILKTYADAMPDLYDRNSNPDEGLSVDMVWNIAEGLGINLPNQYAIKSLIDYTVGEVGQVAPKVYRKFAAETWKRFLHNHIFLTKSKGTKAALRGLLNAYGVLPTTVQIRETATPSFFATQSFELIEEQTNTLNVRAGSYINIPWTDNGIANIQSIQMRFATTQPSSSVIVNLDGGVWTINLTPTGRENGFVSFNINGTPVMSSNIVPLFDGSFYSLTVQRDGMLLTMTLQQSDDDGDLIYNSQSTGSSIDSLSWLPGNTLQVGSPDVSQPFIGLIDEFRMWSEYLTPSTIEYHTKYPGLYNGNTITSARDNLLVRLSFTRTVNLGNPSPSLRVLVNESPYMRSSSAPTQLRQITATGFPNESVVPNSMQVTTRNIVRFTPNAGGSQYVTNKIKIVDPPVLRNIGDNTNLPVLLPNKSIVTLDEKRESVKSNNTIGFFFSITDAINDSIIRSIGNVDIQDYIGNPQLQYAAQYIDLQQLSRLYWTNYAYTYNYNSFAEFVETLLQPLFKQAEELVPARSKLLSGIVLEPHILERSKIKWNPLETSGKGTFDETVTPTLESTFITTQPSVVDGVYNTLDVITDASVTLANVVSDTQVLASDIQLTDTDLVFAENATMTSSINLSSLYQPLAARNDYETFIPSVYDTTEVVPEIVSIDDETDTLNYLQFLLRRFRARSLVEIRENDRVIFNQLWTTYRPRTRITIDSGYDQDIGINILPITVEPRSDFNLLESTTYFINPFGFVFAPLQVKTRVNNTLISNAGVWSPGTVYQRDQYVLQTSQSGAAEGGNSIEYLCTTDPVAGTFASFIPPSLDTTNWSRVRYVYTTVPTLRVATKINNRIELVESGSGYTPFIGYAPQHYRFTRDTSTGTRRRLWLGCKTSEVDTFDGGPAFEIIPSAGDTLIVTTGAEPIRPIGNQSGPRLDVR